MFGLIRKDFYTILKQMRFCLVFLAFMCIVPNSSVSAFVIMYSAILPLTALAYDERSKWPQLAAMMPYTKFQLVFSKYLFGYILAGITLAFCFIVNIVRCLLDKTVFSTEDRLTLLMLACFGTVMTSFLFPLVFKVGVEKGRMVFMLTTIVLFIGILSIEKFFPELPSVLNFNVMLFAMITVAVIVVINVVSIAISTALYENQR